MATVLWPLLVTALALAAAVFDFRTRRIPNPLTYGGLIAALGLALWPGLGPAPGAAALGLVAGFLPALALFAVGILGGGDVKLLAALGALVGYPLILALLFHALVAGCAISLAVLIWQGRVWETVKGLGSLLRSLLYPGTYKIAPATDIQIPFGVAIALGTLWVLYVPPGSQWLPGYR